MRLHEWALATAAWPMSAQADAALVSVVATSYLLGVSTRRDVDVTGRRRPLRRWSRKIVRDGGNPTQLSRPARTPRSWCVHDDMPP
jgi:hypothetical protein